MQWNIDQSTLIQIYKPWLDRSLTTRSLYTHYFQENTKEVYKTFKIVPRELYIKRNMIMIQHLYIV